jgi:hypothetical protein
MKHHASVQKHGKRMHIEGKGGLGGLAAAGFIVGFAILLGIPEVFGVSLGWGLRGVDRGHTEVRAYTPKSTDVESGGIFLSEGEELVATYDFHVESGRAWVSVYTWGWVPGWGDLQWFHRNSTIRSPAREEVRIIAPRSGFYEVGGTLVAATGTFTIDWQVERSTIGGQGFRMIRFAMDFVPLLLLALLLVGLGAAGIRAIAD